MYMTTNIFMMVTLKNVSQKLRIMVVYSSIKSSHPIGIYSHPRYVTVLVMTVIMHLTLVP